MSYGPPHSPFTQSALTADRVNKKKRRTRVLVVLLALVLCMGSGIIWAAAGSDDEQQGKNPTAARQAPDDIRDTVEKLPRTPEGRLAVDYNEDEFEKKFKKESVRAPGAWATDKNFVRGIGSTLKSFKFGTFEEDWSKELTGPICDTTRHVTADGRTAVLLQERVGRGVKDDEDSKGKKPKDNKGKDNKGKSKKGKSKKGDGKKDKKDKGKGTEAEDKYSCTQLAFFDLNTGEKLWQVKLPDAKGAYAPNTNVTMTRGTVAVAWGYGSVAYDMKRGRELWSTSASTECRDLGFAGGRDLLALAQCGDASEPRFKVQKVRPRTGEAEWTYKVTRGVGRVYLVSSDPVVLAVSAGDITVTDLITLDDQGEYQATIDMPEDRFLDNCHRQLFGNVETCDAIVVGRDQLFVATDEGRLADNWIVSYDLSTGKTVRKFDSKPDLPIHPLRMSGGKLLAFRPSSDSFAPAAVLSLDPRTGKQTPYLFFSMPDRLKMEDPQETEIIIEDGRIFFAPRELFAENGGPWEGMAFGALGIEGI
ncbi:PQQ-binding-like beta-propeller repeat protein [Streptomyces sp. NPDC050147]|uniref:outer membrane protein assembly factor BamB family protein n=1 Tax=Streptomyces sp. NPDC050147 TaxID=3155513 RepID=UPI003449B4FB